MGTSAAVRCTPAQGQAYRSAIHAESDVQDYADHKNPRTTRRYDYSRGTLDRKAAYTVAAYLA